MNKTKIEWCDYTWNPVVGCQNGCSWCWARRWNKRLSIIPDFNKPKFFSSRLRDPYRKKKPSRIAVCLMGDLFSPGVTPDWINRVMFTIRMNDQHTFMLLTKFPHRLAEFIIPENCWIGTSVSSASDAGRIKSLDSCSCKYTRFLSIEPLLGSMAGADLKNIDHVFVGAQTGPASVEPEKDWIESIRHPSITWKENIKPYLSRYGIYH